jgi:cysteinyl-tRNA synthetase
LQGHYRNRVNFSWESLQAAQNRLNDLRAWADLRYQPDADQMPQELDELFRDTRVGITEALRNDLNTPLALSVLSKLVAYMQTNPVPSVEGKYTNGTLKLIDDLLGLDLSNRQDINDNQKQIIAEREKARKEQNWEKADQLRSQLIEDGVELNDTPYGPKWSRI